MKAVEKLSGSLNSMTAEVYAQVRALVEQGKEQEAVRLCNRNSPKKQGAWAKPLRRIWAILKKAGWA